MPTCETLIALLTLLLVLYLAVTMKTRALGRFLILSVGFGFIGWAFNFEPGFSVIKLIIGLSLIYLAGIFAGLDRQ